MGGKEWREYEGLDGHELDQDVEGRPRCVLARVADHGGLVSCERPTPLDPVTWRGRMHPPV